MARVKGGAERASPFELLLPRERDQQDGVRRGDANRHDRAHERRDVERGAGDEQHREDADQGRRQRQDDDERVAEILIVDDHQQIDKHRSKQEADAQIPEGIVDLAENLNRIAGLQLLLESSDDLVDVARNAAEIAALRAGVDLVHRLNIVFSIAAVYPHRRHLAAKVRVFIDVLAKLFAGRDWLSVEGAAPPR
jgi:hypothetical protein